MGISWDEFWRLNPRKIALMSEGYKEKYEIELDKANIIAHLQGQYFAEAIMATIGNAFGKKGQTPHEYPKNPYKLFEDKTELTEEEIALQRNLFVEQMKLLKANFDNAKSH